MGMRFTCSILILALICLATVPRVESAFTTTPNSIKALAQLTRTSQKVSNTAILTQIAQADLPASESNHRIIKSNQDVAVHGSIIVKKSGKFDQISISPTLFVSENLYAQTIECSKVVTTDAYIQSISAKDTSIKIAGRIIAKKLSAIDRANVSALTVNGKKQWQVIEHEDFEEQVSTEVENQNWSLIQNNSCEGTTLSSFNGGFCKVSSQKITRTFNNLPSHSQIKISAVFHAFDNWQGENLIVLINGEKAWSKSISNNKGSSVCGSNHPDSINIKFEKIIENTQESLEVSFLSSLTKDACEASFAIDDISLSLR